MKTTAITLMEAYIIENLRNAGVSDEQLIHIDDESIKEWQALNDRFDYTLLKNLAEQNPADYESMIKQGYKVKFLTLNGLINLMELKFNKQRSSDFKMHDDGITELKLGPDEQKELKHMLSANWKVTESEKGLSIRA